MRIVEKGIFLSDVVEMVKARIEEVIQGFALKAPDPRLDESVGVGGERGRAYFLDPGATEQATEPAPGELAVTIVEQELGIQPLLIEPHGEVAELLLDPPLVGVIVSPPSQCRGLRQFPLRPIW
jgi:hypothetical protein